MSIAYFKRFRMEIGLTYLPPIPRLPEGDSWVPWDEGILNLHAGVHHLSFSDAIDSELFPSFSDYYGCIHLLREIRRKPGFVPEATWLVADGEGCCGTVQGVADSAGNGSIQNVGITPAHRGLGIGTALILQALHGFRDSGIGRVFLEVTAENDRALRLYQRLGFRKMKTLYKSIDD